MLNLTLDGHDEVIDLRLAGLRKLDGWDEIGKFYPKPNGSDKSF